MQRRCGDRCGFRYTVAKIDKVDTDVSTAESRNGASEVLTLTDLDGDNSNDYYDKYDDAEKTLRGYASSYDEGTVLAVAFRDGKFGDEVLASYEAEAVTGEVTAFREDETVTMDGTKYEFARSRMAPLVSWTAPPATSTSTRNTPST